MRTVAIAIACMMFAGPLWAQEAQVGGYETYAVVEPTLNGDAALPLAEEHCKKYGRFAYFRHMDAPRRAVFDCTVEKPKPRPVAPFSGRGIY